MSKVTQSYPGIKFEYDGKGRIVSERWLTNDGILHRAYGAALRIFDWDKQTITEERHRFGEHRNDDQPFRTIFSMATGRPIFKGWTNGINYHRNDDCPAIIEYCLRSGEFSKFVYMKNGLVHREDDQPALIIFSQKTNTLISRTWYQNGLIHRENKLHAKEIYDPPSENDPKLEYWENGQQISLSEKTISKPYRIRYNL